MTSALDDVRRALSDEYDVQRLLGRGGMATVYLAEDRKRGGLVAVKVLEPDLAGSLGHARFLREIRIASSIKHPGILTVQDSGEAGGMLYYVMPFVDGESLRERMDRERQLPIHEAVSIAAQVATALDVAHARGFVHRDIKPENIMLSGGRALMADFGIARAVDQAGTDKLTATGLAMGTPAYMSPEQSAGDKVDGRSDLYALGCVTFEMLVGEPPFTGPTAQVILARHSIQPVPSLRVARSTVSPEIEDAVRRAMAKVPADRFPSAAKFAQAITAPTALALGDSMPHVGASTSERAAGSRRRVTQVGAVLVALMIAVAGYLAVMGAPGTTAPPRSRIVVLPFRNVGAAEDEYFADGITEEITARLSGVASLGVIARTSAIQYRNSAKTVDQIGEELDVAHLIEGSVRWERASTGRPNVRIAIRLVRISDKTSVWREDVTVELSQVFAVQAMVAEKVVEALDRVIIAPERQRLATRPTENMTAYDYYLHGNFYYNRSWERGDVDSAILMYERAAVQDPRFASAWAQLGKTHVWKHRLGFDETPERLALSREAIAKAVQLGPELPETHIAQGLYYYWGEWNFERAVEALTRARAIQPSNAAVYLQLGNIRRRQGEWRESLKAYEIAGEFDPRSHIIWFNIGHLLLHIREYDQALRYLERALTLQPTFLDAHLMKIALLIGKSGDVTAARQWFDSTARLVPPERWRLLPVHWLSGTARTLYPSPAERLGTIVAGRFGLDTSLALLARAEALTQLGARDAARATTDSAVAALEAQYRRTPVVPSISGALGVAYAYAGRKREAVAAAQRAKVLMPDALDGPYWIINEAMVQLMVGNRVEAMDALELSLKIPSSMSAPRLTVDPTWSALRGDPRFAMLIARGSPPVPVQ